ncbi:hypothetical protein RN001_014517 [Aquatica leii]|uniref:Uncharacterized protein n=1 Tax=Aquatica leii TaxID=1421715 RepID=A0AAN7SKK8_9COLE|nr:hypothetical protein RN001_014517 [Aquatica leii]
MGESKSGNDADCELDNLGKTKSFTNYDNRIVSQSILGVLEDKNKFIALLKKQIQNQKVQLQFYLHKGFGASRIVDMAKDCVPNEAEENLAVNLALVKFCNQTGFKSRIAILHDRMIDMEKKLLKVIENQEDAIQEVFKNCENQNDQSEMFAKILESTCILRSELEAFRTCCNRLIVIEDERNDLVEQVYSIPVSERINYNALLATLHEKTRLECEIMEIKNEQKELLSRLNSVNSVDNHADEKMTKAMKRRGNVEINRLKEANIKLAAKVNALEQDVQSKEIVEDKMEKVIDEYQQFRENAAKQLNELHNKLGDVIEENEKLTNVLSHYKDIEDEVKNLRDKFGDVEGMQKERDNYKIKFEELQTIRDTYAQIVQKPFDTLREADRIIMQQREQLQDMDAQLQTKKDKIVQLNMTVEAKDNEIKELAELVNACCMEPVKEHVVHQSANTEVNTMLKNYKDVGCNFDNKPPSPNLFSQGTNFDRCFLKKSEEKFLRVNELNTKKMYSKPVPVTTLKVHSTNKKGITDTLRAVVESTSPVDGIIQLTNNSTFTVRLTCGAQMESENSTQPNANNVQVKCTNLSNAFKCSTIVMDEFELMKDSSNEVLVPRVPSFHSLPQRKIVERQRQVFVDKCEELTIDSIYPPETRTGCSDITNLDNSEVDVADEDDVSSSNSTADTSFKDRLKRIVDNSLCRQVLDKLFHEEKKET